MGSCILFTCPPTISHIIDYINKHTPMKDSSTCHQLSSFMLKLEFANNWCLLIISLPHHQLSFFTYLASFKFLSIIIFRTWRRSCTRPSSRRRRPRWSSPRCWPATTPSSTSSSSPTAIRNWPWSTPSTPVTTWIDLFFVSYWFCSSDGGYSWYRSIFSVIKLDQDRLSCGVESSKWSDIFIVPSIAEVQLEVGVDGLTVALGNGTEKLAEATRKYAALKSELAAIKQNTQAERDGKGKKLLLKRGKQPAMKVSDLRLAFSEYYLSLILLQNYQNLNFTGFRKILKKHDKVPTNP